MSRIVVATRMPRPIDYNANHILDAVGDAVVSCDGLNDQGKPCGWSAMGPRSQLKQAVQDHRRMYHSQATDPLVTLINSPSQ